MHSVDEVGKITLEDLMHAVDYENEDVVVDDIESN